MSVPVLAVLLLPTAILPKLMVGGETLSCPAAGALPVPVNAMVTAESDALELITRLPLAEPVVDGVKERTIVELCPGATVNGMDGAVTIANEAPLKVSCETEMLSVVELLVTEKELVLLLPTVRLPKSIEVLPALRPAEEGEERETLLLEAVPPPHPTRGTAARSKSANRYRRGIILLHLTT